MPDRGADVRARDAAGDVLGVVPVGGSVDCLEGDGEQIMKAMVVAVVALASALGREPGEAVRDRPVWAEEAAAAVVLPRMVDDDDAGGDLASVLAPEMGAEELAG